MDPYFDVVAARVRGSDFGDDAELIAVLESRCDQDLAHMEGEDWLLLAVLRHRAGDDEDALSCLERAARMGHSVSLARYMQGQISLRAGRCEDASEWFDAAAAANAEHQLVPASVMIHARGSVARAESRFEDALALYHRALQLDGRCAGRWRATADLLLELHRPDEARAMLEKAIEEDPEDPETRYLLGVTSAILGEADTAMEWLTPLVESSPAMRGRLAVDERIANGVATRSVLRLLHGPPASELEWLAEFPRWLARLREAPMAERLGLRWLTEDESNDRLERLWSFYGRGPLGTMHTPSTLRLSREILGHCRPVALGPISITRNGKPEPMLLLIDEDQPDRLLLALSEAYPPFLWLDAGQTAQSLLDCLSSFFPRPQHKRVDMPIIARGFMGYRFRFGVPSPYTGEIEPASVAELDRHFALNPFVETASWGSLFSEDPWPDEIPAQPDLATKVEVRQREVSAQAEGAVWSVTRRTRHSRSYLSVELHHRDVFVAEVRYRPAPHAKSIARMNAHFGCDYPEDMPIDAVAALLGFQFDAIEDLTARLDATSEPDEIAGLLTVLSALRHSDLGIVRFYRRYMDHPEPVVRTTLCNIFVAYNYESMLEEMCLMEPDAEIRAQIEPLLNEGIPVPVFDPQEDDLADEVHP